MKTTLKQVRLPESLIEYAETQGSNFSQGVINILERDQRRDDAVSAIRRYSEHELKGMFTEKEWSFFADSLNGVMITDTFRYIVTAFIAHNEDAERLEGVATRWDVDVSELNKKCEKLTAAQMDALYARVERFWENSASLKLEDWAKVLC